MTKSTLPIFTGISEESKLAIQKYCKSLLPKDVLVSLRLKCDLLIAFCNNCEMNYKDATELPCKGCSISKLTDFLFDVIGGGDE